LLQQYITHQGIKSETETAIKEMRDKKATAEDDVPVEVLKLENGHKLMTQLISNMYETGEWPHSDETLGSIE
jgi:hypothetical protein